MVNYTPAGLAMSNRLLTITNDLGVERLCNELGELRAKIEALETANTARTIEILRLTNAIANQVPDRTKLFVDVMPDGDDYEPTPNDRQIRSSLVERVQAAIKHSYPDEARAAIREVAAALKDCGDLSGFALGRWLEQEAERG